MKFALRPIFLALTVASATIAGAQASHNHASHRAGTTALVIPCRRTTWPASAHEFVCNIIHSVATHAGGPE